MPCTKYAPKKFLFFFSLEVGATVTAVIMIHLMFAMSVVWGMWSRHIKESCDKKMQTLVFNFMITGCVYSIILMLFNLWFLVGVRKKMQTIILAWVAVTSIWLFQTFCLTMVWGLSRDLSVTTLLAGFVLALLSLIFIVYLFLVVIGYWIELKEKTPTATP